MNEKHSNHELDLFDILKALRKRLIPIICITLAFLIAGGAFGAILAVSSNDMYGTTAEFYIYSEKANEYILSLIKSDSFAEALLLDEYGLPAQYKDTKEYAELLKSKKEIDRLYDELKAMERDFEVTDYTFEATKKQKEYNDKVTAYKEKYDLLAMYKTAMDTNVVDAEAHNARLVVLEAELKAAEIARDEAKAAYDVAFNAKQEAEKAIEHTQIQIKNIEKDIEEPLNKLLDKFRNEASNKSKLNTIKSSVTYSYSDSVDVSSQALLSVTIAVPNDPQMADFILDAIVEKLPDYIEKDTLPFQDTSCEFISTFSSVKKLQVKDPVILALVYGAIAAGGSFIVTCAVIIVANGLKAKKQTAETADEESDEKAE